MSAIVCGKRSFFEELTVTSPPVSKRIRCSSSSPVRFSPPRSNTLASNPPSFNFGSSSSSSSTLIEQLAAIFPDMDKQVRLFLQLFRYLLLLLLQNDWLVDFLFV